MERIEQILLTFLVNACWLTLLIAGTAAVCARLLHSAKARQKYILWVLALVISCVLSIAICFRASNLVVSSVSGFQNTASFSDPLPENERGSVSSNTPVTRMNTAPVEAIGQTWTTANKASSPFHFNINRAAAMVVVLFYLLFLGYRSFRLINAWLRTRSIVRCAFPAESDKHVDAILSRCQNLLGIKRIRILRSTSIAVPVTVGTVNPVIILPDQLCEEIDAELLTSALGHELVHVARRDYLFNAICEIICLPLSFHPAATLIRRRINQNRELGCDELVTEKLLEPRVYARSLVRLASSAVPVTRSMSALTVGINDADILEERITTMLKQPGRKSRKRYLLLLAGFALLTIPCVAAPFAFRVGVSSAKIAPITTSRSVQTPAETLTRPREDAVTRGIAETAPSARRTELPARQPSNRGSLEANARFRNSTVVVAPVEPLGDEPVNMGDLRLRTKEADTQRAKEERENLERNRMSSEEMESRIRSEQEMRSRRQAEMARQARIPMSQAVRIATSQAPGTVTECGLGVERDTVVYRIQIISAKGSEAVVTRVMVSAIDGQVMSVTKQ
ncbi:MAG TPA: M56 family metallopeptidase [Blastocatellia bacterium]|nr:M56 family metallopeptidase [Blastocatellia bacterium]